MIVSAQRLAHVFVEVADTLVDEFDAADFLHMLTLRVADLIGASAVGILLADGKGELQFAAASDEGAKAVELFRPRPVKAPAQRRTAPETRDQHGFTHGCPRWPGFAAHATAAGFTSVHAFPLRLRSQVIGALNVFSQQVETGLDDGDIHIVQALADLAAIALLQERTISRGEVLADQLQNALNTRIIIERVKGAIAQAHHVSVDTAFTILRSHARRHNQKLSALAVIHDPAVLAELTER